MIHLKRLGYGLGVFAGGLAICAVIVGLGKLVMLYPVYAASAAMLFVSYCLGCGIMYEKNRPRGNGVDW